MRSEQRFAVALMVLTFSAGCSVAAASGKSSDPQSCEKASDCRGVLPHLCRQCLDGGTACAHWACASGKCRRQLCT